MAEEIETIYALANNKTVKRGLGILRDNERAHKLGSLTVGGDDHTVVKYPVVKEEKQDIPGVAVQAQDHPESKPISFLPNMSSKSASRTRNRQARYQGPGSRSPRPIGRYNVASTRRYLTASKTHKFGRRKASYGRRRRPKIFKRFYRRRR